jgi:hypothetical protein
MPTVWEPGRNAVHGLIQLIDVLAIALGRFQQSSFELPAHDDPAFPAESKRLWDDYSEIAHAVFPRADVAPQHTAARLAYLAVAELVRAGSRDVTAVDDAQRWMSDRGWILVPHVAPKGVDSEQWQPFNSEAELLSQHGLLRHRLFAALAQVGQTVPDEVVQRGKLAVWPLGHAGGGPVPQPLLLGWVREAARSSDAPSSRGSPPQFPPAVAEHLERWRTDTARYAAQVRAYDTAFEAAREVFEVWQRVAYFTGREADRDGRRATDEESRECYVNLLLDLGRTLVAVGYGGRVEALAPGTEGTRVLAVELLRRTVAGDRQAVVQLDRAMREAAFVGGAAAAAYLRNELRYEVLGIRPPVPVPPGWEGPLPDTEIRTPAELIAWIDHRLEVGALFFGRRADRSDGVDVRNAHRLLTHLNILHEHPFPHEAMRNGDIEAHLRNLRTACLADRRLGGGTTDVYGVHETGSTERPIPKPADGPVEPSRFRWGGFEGEFLKDERRYHRLLVSVWPTFRWRTSTRLEDVNKKLEDLGGSTLEPRTMQNYARELSKILTERFKFPARLELDDDFLVWRDLPDTTASA